MVSSQTDFWTRVLWFHTHLDVEVIRFVYNNPSGSDQKLYPHFMTHNLSLLQRASRIDVVESPFPYLVIENALPKQTCEALIRTYPSLKSQGIDESLDNVRWSTHAEDIGTVAELSPIWKKFVEFHTSQEFFDQVIEIFAVPLSRMYGSFFTSKDSVFQKPVVVRDNRRLAPGRFSLDAQISGNTPAKSPGAPRGIHIDAPNALYGGLYYLRDEADDSEGGDLQIWKWRDGYSHGKKSGEYREGVDEKHVELIQTIKYKANTLVLFINSLDSLHSVTVRKPTVHTRKFLNLLADTDQPLFKLTPSPHLRMRNIIRRRLIT